MTPIFIVGCERSGTTMLGAMLGSHPRAVCTPESQFLAECLPATPDVVDADELLDWLERHWKFRLWEFPLDGARPPPEDGPYRYADIVYWIVRRYGASHERENPAFWIEHWPGKIDFLHRLLQHFPAAKVIHIVRDGRAVAASLLRVSWGPNDMHSAAHHWALNVGLGYSAGGFLDGSRLSHVRYEDLVNEPEATLRRLCAFAGLEYVPDMVLARGFALPGYTQEQHALVGSRPNAQRVDAWRTLLSPRQVELFESFTDDLLAYHGYPLQYGGRPRPATARERAARKAQWFVGRIRNKIAQQRLKLRYGSREALPAQWAAGTAAAAAHPPLVPQRPERLAGRQASRQR